MPFEIPQVDKAKKALVAFLVENCPQVAAIEIKYDSACGMEIRRIMLFDSLGPGANSFTVTDKRLNDLALALCENLVTANVEFAHDSGPGTVWVCASDIFHIHEVRDGQDND